MAAMISPAGRDQQHGILDFAGRLGKDVGDPHATGRPIGILAACRGLRRRGLRQMHYDPAARWPDAMVSDSSTLA